MLDDLAALPLEALASRTLHGLARLVALAFWSSRSFRRLQEAAPLMRAVTGALARDEPTRTLLAHLYLYLLRAAQPDVELEDVRTILLQVAGPQGQEDVVNAAEQLIQQGVQQGLRNAIVTILSVRGITLSTFGQGRLASCVNADTLNGWLARADTASSEVEVFGNGEGR